MLNPDLMRQDLTFITAIDCADAILERAKQQKEPTMQRSLHPVEANELRTLQSEFGTKNFPMHAVDNITLRILEISGHIIQTITGEYRLTPAGLSA